MPMPRLLAIAFLTASLPLAAVAQEKDTQGGSATDAGFFKNAGASGQAEVAFAGIQGPCALAFRAHEPRELVCAGALCGLAVSP